MRATSVELPQRQVALHIGSSFSEGWTEVIRPWLELVARVSQSTGRYVAIVTPFRSNAYAIKQLALNCGMSLLGVRFISPAELREMLAAGGESCAPSREHLRLL